MPEDAFPRLAGILDAHSDRLWEAARRQDRRGAAAAGCTGAADVLRLLAEADPHPRKACTQWLVNAYVRGGMRLEDRGKARETLELFMARRSSLPPDLRDLGRHETLADLWKAVAPADVPDVMSNRELERQLREEAREESDILLEREDGFKVVVPLSIRAARWWGRGTRWCTAADKDNAFREYDDEAPLVVIILPDGRKMQVFALPIDFQMCDEADAPVTTQAVEEAWDILGPVVEWAISRSGKALRFVPDRHRTRDHYVKAVSASDTALREVPAHFMDVAMCHEAVQNYPKAFRFVPMSMRNREICLLALQVGPEILREIPASVMDRNAWLHAVTLNADFARHVPHGILDREMMMAVVRSSSWGISLVDGGTDDKELCMEAVRAHGFALLYIPSKKRTQPLCDEAFKSQPGVFEFVPGCFRTRPMWLKALAHDGSLLDRLSVTERDREACLTAVRSRGRALEWVPTEERDLEMCLAAASSSFRDLDLEHVPERLMSQVAAATPPPEEFQDPLEAASCSWELSDLDGLRAALLEVSDAPGLQGMGR